MYNLIPTFIQEQYERGCYNNNSNSYVMFMDISGFTAMTEKLMSASKNGAEILSNIINKVFSSIIDVVYHYGGFIATFAGDALTIIFPKELVGLKWENSIYEQLDAKLRFENTIYYIKKFFLAQSLLKPTIIFIEDLQMRM